MAMAYFAELQRLLNRVADEADGREVGLIGARRAEHVDHFFGHVDVRHRDEAVGVRVGVRRLVAAPERRLVLDDVGDLARRRRRRGRAPRRTSRSASPSSTTSRRRYGWPSAPRVDSALARFETATSMRARCASSALALALMAPSSVDMISDPR